jgi:hypothetical protein
VSNDYDLLRQHYRDQIRALNKRLVGELRDPRRNQWFAERRVLMRKLANFEAEHKSINPDTYGDW